MIAGIHAVGIACPLGVGADAVGAAWAAGTHRDSDSIGRIKLRRSYPRHGALVRRLDRVGKLVAAAASAMEAPPPGPVSLGLGTDLGCAETSYEFLGRLGTDGPRAVQPFDFPNLVPNAAAGHLGLLRGWTGPSLTFTGHEGGAHGALEWGLDEVAAGRTAVVGAVEDCGEVRRRLQARGLEGRHPAEGAALLVLGEPRRGEPALLAAWSAFDPHRRSAFVGGADPDILADLLERVQADAGVVCRQVFPSEALVGAFAGMAEHDIGPRTGRWGGDAALRAALAVLRLSDGPSLIVTASRGGGVHGAVVGRAP